MGRKIKNIFSKIEISGFDLKVIIAAVIILIAIQIAIFSKTKVAVVVDEATGETGVETRFGLSKDFIKAKIKNMSDEDKAWLKKEFGYYKKEEL